MPLEISGGGNAFTVVFGGAFQRTALSGTKVLLTLRLIPAQINGLCRMNDIFLRQLETWRVDCLACIDRGQFPTGGLSVLLLR